MRDGGIPVAGMQDDHEPHARELGIRHAIIPSANLAGTTKPTGIEVIGVSRINELLDQ